MSDEEYSEYEEEEEVEEEVEQEVEEHHAPAKRSAHASETVHDEGLNEAEKAMQAAKRRQEDEDKAKLMDYEERRRYEREKEEEELKLLKEKQEQRRLQREEEDRQQAEKRRLDEEKRIQEENERKARMEADRKKKEDEKMKRAQLMGGFTAVAGAGTGRNFVIPEKKDKSDKFGNIVQAKQEMGMTKEQQEEAKEAFLDTIRKAIDLDSVLSGDLKAKIKEMHSRICKLEADKYDLEKRHERQTYDLKELNERQRQVARNRNSKEGAQDDTGGRHPPKIPVVNKYDRQIDRRNFKERRAMFDKKDAFPCFPNIPPPPTILEFKPKKEIKYDVYQNEEVEEAEEEYEEGGEEEEEEEEE